MVHMTDGIKRSLAINALPLLHVSMVCVVANITFMTEMAGRVGLRRTDFVQLNFLIK